MNKVKISVIMSAYNSESTIVEAVNSILEQTYQDFEFIICDDCSTDGTYKILLEYQKQFPEKIVLIKNKINSKLAFSLNHCLQYSKGKYVARMDADDISCSERLEKQILFLLSHSEYDLVGTSMLPFDNKGEYAPIQKKEIPNKFDLVTGPCFNHATVLVKKSVYDALGGYLVLKRTTRGQDHDLWFRFFKSDFRGYNMHEPLYKVRERFEDMRRRNFKSSLYAVQTRLVGYKLLKYSIHYYIYAFKPIIVGLIPKRIMFSYHRWCFMKKQK